MSYQYQCRPADVLSLSGILGFIAAFVQPQQAVYQAGRGIVLQWIHPHRSTAKVMEMLEGTSLSFESSFAMEVPFFRAGPDLFDFLAQRSSKLEERIAAGLVKHLDCPKLMKKLLQTGNSV